MLRWPQALYVRVFRLLFARRFLRFGRGVKLIFPAGIDGAGHIALGDDIHVEYKSYLAAVPHTSMPTCLLEIGSGSRLGRFNHVYATHRVVLGRHVLTANNVYISDNLHGYQDPDVPILKQPVRQNGVVEIGDGSWIGHNACILGARIGRQCVVGANAVVTRDVPDHCVVAGAPAVIIRRYDPASGTWRKTHPDGRMRQDLVHAPDDPTSSSPA